MGRLRAAIWVGIRAISARLSNHRRADAFDALARTPIPRPTPWMPIGLDGPYFEIAGGRIMALTCRLPDAEEQAS